MSIGSFNLEREFINWGGNYFKIILFKNFSNGKTGIWKKKGLMILIFNWSERDVRDTDFFDLNRALSTTEGL